MLNDTGRLSQEDAFYSVVKTLKGWFDYSWNVEHP